MTDKTTLSPDWRNERIKIGGRSYLRFLLAPSSVDDGTLRCIGCGQIDDEPWHDHDLCRAVQDERWGATGETR